MIYRIWAAGRAPLWLAWRRGWGPPVAEGRAGAEAQAWVLSLELEAAAATGDTVTGAALESDVHDRWLHGAGRGPLGRRPLRRGHLGLARHGRVGPGRGGPLRHGWTDPGVAGLPVRRLDLLGRRSR